MKKFQKMMSIVCMIGMLLSFTACGSSGGSQSTGGQPETPEEAVSTQEETDKNSDTEAVEQTTDQDTEVAEPADTEDESGEETSEESSKVLVAYFSATGTTKALAEYAADALGADLYEIVPEEPYTDEDLNYSDSSTRATVEQNDKTVRPAISGSVENMDQYEIVFLGYPIWWGEAPRIVDTFMESYEFGGKTIVPFCTSGSSGIGSSAANLHDLCGDDVTWLDGVRLGSSSSREDIVEWINSLGLNVEAK
ncbi:flavodoxin-like protein [Hungatella effluvii]|uniref:Flavodoxin-like protein n=1 Tax=Hungatella effluvii TaxID=1096246 RepID=A0A2V3YKY2_9FIRM|nr:flavodoxin [Hungatella effluvii]PXX54274.1 flavodoxin-like protein [Hungatella effluvii]